MRWTMGAIIFLSLIVMATVVLAVALWQRHGNNSPPVASQRGKTTDYQPFKTFKTDYFRFQTDQNWQAVVAESTPDSFVYRAFKGKLVERDLTVYVNTLPPRLMLTYVLPVRVQDNRLLSGDISAHCRDYLPASYLAGSRAPMATSFKNVAFTCQTDGTSTTIGTGVEGGSYQAIMRRAGNNSAKYFLLYHDLTLNPRPGIFKSIVDSFESL